ncbi:MAG: rhomboid family intramembrane serine protease [Coleofasciculaceae cyanobacterium SM2_3_26]|nr:rhomboid family intramembrane serine protease [Coleofasciculaceae cyanobacterium SM2_3_26]
MFPIGDENPTRQTSYVVYTLIGINVAVFLHQLSLSQPQMEAFFQTWAIVPQQLTSSFQGVPPTNLFPEWGTLISSQFLHGGFLHLLGNMLYLWIFGNNIEDRLGHVKFTVFYLACGILAGLSQWFFSTNSAVPLIGASGAIAGVMGAYILRFPHAQIRTLVTLGFFITSIRVPAIFFLGFWFVQQAFFSFISLGVATQVQEGGVAYWAHAGGFVFGALLAPLFGLFQEEDL